MAGASAASGRSSAMCAQQKHKLASDALPGHASVTDPMYRDVGGNPSFSDVVGSDHDALRETVRLLGWGLTGHVNLSSSCCGLSDDKGVGRPQGQLVVDRTHQHRQSAGDEYSSLIHRVCYAVSDR